MKVFYDLEFLEDGATIDLISVGMVREDGAEYYAINEDADWYRIVRDEWLMKNVVPTLVDSDYVGALEFTQFWKPQPVITNEIYDFVTHGLGKGETAELVGWYSAYDHVRLCQLFGKMIDLPKGFPMFTRDLRQEVPSRKYLPEQEGTAHNALEDARWVAKAHEAWSFRRLSSRV